jgi:hypothetical protein
VEQKKFILQAAKTLWHNDIFKKNSGAGVRGTTRLSRLLPLAKQHLNPGKRKKRSS